jgi:hypothetical protein
MFSDLQKIYDREARRLSPDVMKATVVNTVEDLKIALAAIDPSKEVASSDIQLGTTISAQNESQPTVYQVTAMTRSKSKREILIEGLDIVKRHIEAANKAIAEDAIIEINGKMMTPARIGGGESGMTWVDPLIKHWLGAYRDGILLCWDIDNYQYQYDIYAHKLARVSKDEK